MITRRHFMKVSGVAGAGLLLPWKASVKQAFGQFTWRDARSGLPPQICYSAGHSTGNAQDEQDHPGKGPERGLLRNSCA